MLPFASKPRKGRKNGIPGTIEPVEELRRALFRPLFGGRKHRFMGVLELFCGVWACRGTTNRSNNDFFNSLPPSRQLGE
jgi:hypothetical protein